MAPFNTTYERSGVLPSIAALYSADQLTDLTITCAAGKTFKVHRLIVSIFSDFFKKAVTGDFKVSQAGNYLSL